MKVKRNYEVKRSMARLWYHLSIRDKTFNQRDITIDLGLPQIQLTNLTFDKRNLRARSYAAYQWQKYDV